ncbi:MAG: peptide ABC transporter substrate-binding protein [Gemmatimonadota bacterium]|nr:MAG: peptide ABC transporter substrate-binding protein [Gemmatimonadota bacterium]
MGYCCFRGAWPSRDKARQLIMVVLCLSLAACSVTPSGTRRAAVIYASGADLQSINPLVAVHPLAKAVQKHVLFLTLASYDEGMRPVPRLAEWSWNEDRTSLTLQLRPDIEWHDGVTTTSRDVAWTIAMAREPQTAYPRGRDLAAIVAVETVDSLTARLTFNRPQPVFPDVLTDLAILPAHLLQELQPNEIRTAAFNRAPVGNGPFEFVEYRPNQRWVFRRSAEFPTDLGRPAIEHFVVVVVDEPATKLAALTSGELDFAGISPAHAAFVTKDSRLHTIDYPVQFVNALIWNTRRAPFDDVVVRRALTLALDRELIIAAYLYGFGAVAHGPVSPQHPWHYPADPLPFDPDAAVSLLERAGWQVGSDGVRRKGSQRLQFDLMTVGSGDAPLEQMIQAQLREVGVEVRIRQLELTSFLARAQAAERDWDALVTGIPGDLSLSYVAAMFTGIDPGPLAYSGYSSVEFDAAIRGVREAETEAALESAWREAQRILARDIPTTWLYHARGLQGANRRITNVVIDLRGELATICEWGLAGPL